MPSPSLPLQPEFPLQVTGGAALHGDTRGRTRRTGTSKAPRPTPLFLEQMEEQRNQVNLAKVKQQGRDRNSRPRLSFSGVLAVGAKAAGLEQLRWHMGSLSARPQGENSKRIGINGHWDIPRDEILKEDRSWDATPSVLP